MRLSVLVLALLFAVAYGQECTKMLTATQTVTIAASATGAADNLGAFPTLTLDSIKTLNRLRFHVSAEVADAGSRPAANTPLTVAVTSSGIALSGDVLQGDFALVGGTGPSYIADKWFGPFSDTTIRAIAGGASLKFTATLTLGGTVGPVVVDLYYDYCSASTTLLYDGTQSDVSDTPSGGQSLCASSVTDPITYTPAGPYEYSQVLSDVVRDAPFIQGDTTHANIVKSGFHTANLLDVVIHVHDRYAPSKATVTLMDYTSNLPVGDDCTATIYPALLNKYVPQPCYGHYILVQIPWVDNAECGLSTEELTTSPPSSHKTENGSSGLIDALAGIRRFRGRIQVSLTEKEPFDVVTDAKPHATTRDHLTTYRNDTFELLYDVKEVMVQETVLAPRVFTDAAEFEALASVTATPNPDSLLYTIDAKVRTSIQWPFVLVVTGTATVDDTVQYGAPVVTENAAAHSASRCEDPGQTHLGTKMTGTSDSGNAEEATPDATTGATGCEQVFDVHLTPTGSQPVVCDVSSPSVTLFFSVRCNSKVAAADCPLNLNNTAANDVAPVTFKLATNLELCPTITDSVTFDDSVTFYANAKPDPYFVKTDFFENDVVLVEVGASVSGTEKVSVESADVYRISVQRAYSDPVSSPADPILGTGLEIDLKNEFVHRDTCGKLAITAGPSDTDSTATFATAISVGSPYLSTTPTEVAFATHGAVYIALTVTIENGVAGDGIPLAITFAQVATGGATITKNVVATDWYVGVLELTFKVDIGTASGSTTTFKNVNGVLDVTLDCGSNCGTVKLTGDLDVYYVDCNAVDVSTVPAETTAYVTPLNTGGAYTTGTEVVISDTLVSTILTASSVSTFSVSPITALPVVAVTSSISALGGLSSNPLIKYQVHLVRGAFDLVLAETTVDTANPTLSMYPGSAARLLESTDHIVVTMSSLATGFSVNPQGSTITLMYGTTGIVSTYLTEITDYVPLAPYAKAENDYFTLTLDPTPNHAFPNGIFNPDVDEAEFYIIRVYSQVSYANGANAHEFTSSVMSLQSLRAPASKPGMQLMASSHNSQLLKSSKGFRVQHREPAVSMSALTTRLRMSATSMVGVFGGIAMLAVVALAVVVSRRTQTGVVYKALPTESKV